LSFLLPSFKTEKSTNDNEIFPISQEDFKIFQQLGIHSPPPGIDSPLVVSDFLPVESREILDFRLFPSFLKKLF
jgi:hypothetical protein